MKSLQNLLNEAMSNQDRTLCLVKVSNSDGSAWYRNWGVVCFPNEYIISISSYDNNYKLVSDKTEEFEKLYNSNKIPLAVFPDLYGDKKLDWDPCYYNYRIEKLDPKAAKKIIQDWNGYAREAEYFANRVNSLSKYGK